MPALIAPHGGTLISRTLDGVARTQALNDAKQLPTITISKWTISDLEMIGTGVFSPLTGFMDKTNWESVLTSMKLSTGEIWTIPITLPVDETVAAKLSIGEQIALYGEDGILYGTIEVSEVYPINKELEAQSVYLTTDQSHPGVRRLFSVGSHYVAGPITLLNQPVRPDFADLYLSPMETREVFERQGWKTIVGFQTRNPIHRAHEYIQKCALETVDALFVNPLVGETKKDDIPANIRMRSYQVLLQNYYPRDRVMLSVYPAAMRYGGPREAVLHAIARKNYGCTHFIVGRDHAGVGNFYGTYDAQKIFSRFAQKDLGIQPLFFENSFYCDRCDGMASDKTCPHDPEHRHTLSGTRVRELLRNGQPLPAKVSRPEVAKVLLEG